MVNNNDNSLKVLSDETFKSYFLSDLLSNIMKDLLTNRSFAMEESKTLVAAIAFETLKYCYSMLKENEIKIAETLKIIFDTT